MSFIRISQLSFAYEKNPVFQDLNLEIEEGTLCGIMGPNGMGKSTLLKLLAGQLRPTAGRIMIADKEIHSGISKSHADLIATVPQESAPIFGYTVSEMVMMARFIRKKRILFEHPDDWKAIEGALRETGISHLADRPINQLSGGERQRVYLARALAQETPVLLLDEPASHLDMKHQVLVYDLLKRLQRDRKKTTIMVTHDLNLAGQYCDTVILLGQNGKILHGPVSKILSEHTVKHIFDTDCHVISYEGFNFFVPRGKQPVDNSIQ
jgi:iron complex transport system ATP-binding protein